MKTFLPKLKRIKERHLKKNIYSTCIQILKVSRINILKLLKSKLNFRQQNIHYAIGKMKDTNHHLFVIGIFCSNLDTSEIIRMRTLLFLLFTQIWKNGEYTSKVLMEPLIKMHGGIFMLNFPRIIQTHHQNSDSYQFHIIQMFRQQAKFYAHKFLMAINHI